MTDMQAHAFQPLSPAPLLFISVSHLLGGSEQVVQWQWPFNEIAAF